MHGTQLRILQIEDEASDAYLFSIAIDEARVGVVLRRVSDGREATEYLTGKGVYADRDEYPFPDLVVLDLKIPRISGHEFVRWCRSTPSFRHLPIVAFTGSPFGSGELRRALKHGSSLAYRKPLTLNELVRIVREIHRFGLASLKEQGVSSEAA